MLSLLYDHPYYAIYSAINILAAVVIAVVLLVPTWRDRLGTTAWVLLLGLGCVGWGKIFFILLFAPIDLERWSPTVANAYAVVLAVVLGVAALVGIVLWLRHRLQGERPHRRIAGDIAYVGLFIAAIYGIEYVEKHYQLPAFWIAMAVLVPSVLGLQWWREKKDQARFEAEHRRKVIEELSKDPADAPVLERYLRELAQR